MPSLGLCRESRRIAASLLGLPDLDVTSQQDRHVYRSSIALLSEARHNPSLYYRA